MRRLFFAALFCAGIIATAAAFASATVNPALYAGMHWRMIGPFRGGRALAVTGVPGNPTTFYFGAVAGGVWKTDDAGRTWTPVFDGQPIASIGAIAVAPSAPDTLYVGTGEADMRSDITYGNGMYKSTDGGKNWTHIGLVDSRQIARVIVDPADANRVYVAALGHAYGPNAERGVYRSIDGGRTWQRILYKDQNTGAVDLALDPHDSRTIFAALWQTRRPPWNVYPPSRGKGSGLYVSHDGGDTWTQVSGAGFPSQNLGRMGLAISQSDPQRIYVIADARKGGLYRSDDGGRTWALVNGERRLWGRGWYFCSIAADPKDADVVYVSDTAFYRSTDGGKHFVAIKGSPSGDDFHQPWIDPTDSKRMILGSDQGASVSLNGGATWSSWFNQPTAQFYRIAADNGYPFNVYGAQQDNGAAMVPTQSDRIGIVEQDWQPIVAGGESGYIAPDPRDRDVVYGDNVTKEWLSSRQARSLDPTLTQPGLYRSTWTLPLVFSRRHPNILYYSHQVLFRSADGGATWRKISPDLARPDPGVPPTLDGATAADNLNIGARRGVIYTIAPSPVADGLLWCGTDDGKIWRTSDEGGHWRDVTPPQIGPWSKVALIEASAFDANTAYAAVDRHRLEDLRPYIYRTHDGGRSWTQVAAGIPVGAYVNAVREDPLRRGLLYAGTELGVYASFDDGNSWQSLRLNMPVVPVRDLAIRQDSLAIATHGRAFWVLDDLSPLRQIGAGTASSTLALFAPETAVREHARQEPTENLAPEEPAGENRQAGAFIDYYVGRPISGTLRLTIYDGAGALVRSYSSAVHPQAPNPETLDVPPYWAPAAAPLLATPGMHRFLWDLTYGPEAGPAGADYSASGALAAPGRYRIVLQSGGLTYRQWLTVVKDPRVHATDADLVAQFRFTRDIEALHARVATARAAALKRNLSRIAGAPRPVSPDNSVGVPAIEFTSLYAVGNALDRLEAEVQSADTAPTPDEYAAFAHWRHVYAADAAALHR